jgi:alkanesulfonate monooxygenase SsuD/methylene tetrahydromethanopterin reductase-like flavin-dependent oxidoreductase (luciferase family)
MACRRGVTAHMAKSTAQDLAGARGHFVTAGTPEPIADLVEDWFADGCNGMPAILPA